MADYWNGDIPWFSIADAPKSTDPWVIDTEKKITRAGLENSSTRVLFLPAQPLSRREERSARSLW